MKSCIKFFKLCFLGFYLLPVAATAQQAADAFFNPALMQAARESMQNNSGNTTQYLFLGERFEQQFNDGDSVFAWDAQAWIGKDLNRAWFKTEGNTGSEIDDEVELQMLYSRAISTFWDLQLGLRHDFISGADEDYAVVGIQGLAPYWFEIDFAAFVSDTGKLSARAEVEYDLLFTQRLILQPRLELNATSGQGMKDVGIGIRLRYEFKRSFAPYLGLSWKKSYAEDAILLGLQSKDNEEVAVVLGLRFWY